MKTSLLQALAEEIGISYLSDLHSIQQVGNVYSAVCQLPAEKYSKEEWSEAAAYILRQQRKKFDHAEAACQYLRDELEKIKGLH